MIVINCTGSDTIELDELADFQGALKQRSAADINKIIKSIKKHGFSFPFFVWAHDDINHVLDGHGRLAALKKMQTDGEEIPALPCVYVEAENEAEAKEKLLKLNSQYGHMTAESVADFLDGMEIELDDLALPDGVLDLSGIAAPEEETEGDDDAPDVDEDGEPDSQPGEMYELGNSILLCGDSTNPEDVARLMGGEKADVVFSDPPYGMGLDTNYSDMEARGNTEFARRKMKGNHYDAGHVDTFKPELITTVFKNFGYCKEIFLWGADYYAEMLENKNEGSWIVWDKRSNEWDKDTTETFDKMFGSCFELCWSKAKHKRDIARVKWAGVYGTETEFDKKRFHPTQKPIKLIKYFLSRYAKENEVIVDLYGGSGSTLIAAEELDMRARVMELDPHYCDVIRKRWTKWAQENGRKVGSGGLE